MTLTEAYLTSLVNQRIPMINEWLDSLGLEITGNLEIKSKRKEWIEDRGEDTNKVFYSGYQTFDKLNRGYISHKQVSMEYSDETHYLLGHYLRALRDIKNLDYMHLYNCVMSKEIKNNEITWRIPIIKGRCYKVWINTILTARYFVRETLTLDKSKLSKEAYIRTFGVNNPIIFVTDNKNVVGDNIIKIDYEEENLEKIKNNPNYDEFYELDIITGANAAVSAIEMTMESDENIHFEKNPVAYPLISVTFERYSPKLIELLLNTGITDQSNYKIKETALNKYSSPSIKSLARNKTPGRYDIDDYVDKRIIV